MTVNDGVHFSRPAGGVEFPLVRQHGGMGATQICASAAAISDLG